MDVFAGLAAHHQKITELFEHRKSPDKIERLIEELTIYSQIEADFLYPPLSRWLQKNEDLKEMVEECRDELNSVQDLIRQLDASEYEDDQAELLSELQETVELYMENEEDELFPVLRKTLTPEEMEALGQSLSEASPSSSSAA
jgi:spore cortex formation protein SpoVR/YcgB (stage V sporulation)